MIVKSLEQLIYILKIILSLILYNDSLFKEAME